MINRTITCRTVSGYSDNLSRGKSYKVLGVNEEKQMVRVICNHGRHRLFNLDDSMVVTLQNWKFDDEVTDDPRDTNWLEITLQMSDGSKRWCILYTPQRMYNLFNQPTIHPPGIYIKHMIISRSYSYEGTNSTLIYLDEEDELINAILLLVKKLFLN